MGFGTNKNTKLFTVNVNTSDSNSNALGDPTGGGSSAQLDSSNSNATNNSSDSYDTTGDSNGTGEDSGIIVDTTGAIKVDDPAEIIVGVDGDVEGASFSEVSEVTGTVDSLDSYSIPGDDPEIPKTTDNQENAEGSATLATTSTTPSASPVSSTVSTSSDNTVLNASSTSVESALETTEAIAATNNTLESDPNFIATTPPDSSTATSNYTLTSGNGGMTAGGTYSGAVSNQGSTTMPSYDSDDSTTVALEQSVDSLTTSSQIENAQNSYNGNTSSANGGNTYGGAVFPEVPGASVNDPQENQPPVGSGPQQGSTSTSGGEVKTLPTTFDYNGTSYDSLSDAKAAIAAEYGFFDIQNNVGHPNIDASEKVPSDQVTPYSGRIRNLSLDRPEILSLTEFRPLYTIDPDGSLNVKKNTDVLSQYDISNSGLTKTSAGRLFSLQSHLRIVLQDTVNSVFSGLVGYDISSLMKKISHAQENERIFNDVPYSPPFPRLFTNKFVIDYIKLKDEKLGNELLAIGEEKYLNLIFQYFLNSVFADKLFSNRTQSLPSITNSDPIVVKEIQTKITEDTVEETEFSEITYETIVILPSDISTLERAASVSQNISSILTDIFGVFDNNFYSPKIAHLDQFDELAGTLFKAQVLNTGVLSGRDAEESVENRSPDIIQMHRILHNALISVSGIPISAGLSDNISFPDIDEDLAELLSEPEDLSMSRLVDSIASLPFAEFGDFEEGVFGPRYNGDIISAKNDFNTASTKSLFKNIISPLISEDTGLENSLIAMSAFAADLKFAINEKMLTKVNDNFDIENTSDRLDYYYKLSRLFTYIPDLPQGLPAGATTGQMLTAQEFYIDSLTNKNSTINSIPEEKYTMGEVGASGPAITNPFASGYSAFIGGQGSAYSTAEYGLGNNDENGTEGSGGGVGSLNSGNSGIYTSVPSEYGTSYIGASAGAVESQVGIPSALGRLYYVMKGDNFNVGSRLKETGLTSNPTEDNSFFQLNGLAAYTFDGFPEGVQSNMYATLDEISRDGYENQYGFVGYASNELKYSTANVIKDFNDRFELDVNRDTGYRYLEHMFSSLGDIFDYDENNSNQFTFGRLLSIYIFSVAAKKGEAAKSQLLAGILGNYMSDFLLDSLTNSAAGITTNASDIIRINSNLLGQKASSIFTAPSSMPVPEGDSDDLQHLSEVLREDGNPSLMFLKNAFSTIKDTTIYTGTGPLVNNSVGSDPDNILHLRYNKTGRTANVGRSSSDNTFEIFSTLLDHFSRKFYASLPRYDNTDDGLDKSNLYTAFFLEDSNSNMPMSYESNNLDKFFKKAGPESYPEFSTHNNDNINIVITQAHTPQQSQYQDSDANGARNIDPSEALEMIGYDKFSREFNEIPENERDEHVVNLHLEGLNDPVDVANDSLMRGVCHTAVNNLLGNVTKVHVSLDPAYPGSTVTIENLSGEKESRSIASIFSSYLNLIESKSDKNMIGWLLSFEKSFIESEIDSGNMTQSDYENSVSGSDFEAYSHTGINGSSIKRIIASFNILCHIAQNIFPTMMEIKETYHSAVSFNSNELEDNDAAIYYNPEIGKGMADAFKGIENAYFDKDRRMGELNLMGVDEENLDRFINYQFGYHHAEKIRDRAFSIYNDSKKTGIKLLEKIGKIGGIYDFILAGSSNEYNEITSNWTETNVIPGSSTSEVIFTHEIPKPRNPDVFDDLIGLQTPIQLDNYTIMKRKLLRQSISNFYLPASKAISPQQIKNTLRFLSADNRGYKIDKSFSGQRGGKIIMHVGVPAQFLDSSVSGVTGANSTYTGYVAILIKRVDLSTGKTQAYKKSYIYSPALYFVDNCEVPDEVISNATMEDTSDSDSFFQFINKHKLKTVYSGEFNDVVYENVTNSGNTQMDTFLKNTILNHIEDYYLKIYNRIMTGIDLDEDVFQLSDDDGVTISPGADLEPLLGKSDYQYAFKTVLEAKLLNSGLSSEQKTSIANELSRIKSEAERSVFFSPFKYLYRVIRTRVFDRVFSMFVDESNENFIDIDDPSYTRPTGLNHPSFSYEVVNTSGAEDTDGKVGKLYSYFVEFETF